jgi:UDP-2,3-diacylglucosamine pyrophosphatase LpxH
LAQPWRARYGYGYWSLSAYLKHKVKTAVSFISDFEEAIAHECVKRELHGVVCGHIHHAEIRKVGEVDYLNCGDWVEFVHGADRALGWHDRVVSPG